MAENQIETIKVVLFDFGGVLAEEGFREGLMAIARSHGLDPDAFFQTAAILAYDTGYVTGAADEATYWHALRQKTGIKGSDEALRSELLDRFVLRPWMIELVRDLRSRGWNVCILSDQTNWLDELNERYDFFKEFDDVFNSYHVGKGKHDSSLFTDIASQLQVQPGEMAFIDDNEGHIHRAQSHEIHTIHFRDREILLSDLHALGLIP